MKIKFNVPIFYTAVTVSDKIEDVFYTDHDRDLARKSFGQTGWFDGRGVHIYIEPNAPRDTLVHECVHAAGLILKMRGIQYSTPPDDEALAYLTGWIYAEIQKIFNKKNIS